MQFIYCATNQMSNVVRFAASCLTGGVTLERVLRSVVLELSRTYEAV